MRMVLVMSDFGTKKSLRALTRGELSDRCIQKIEGEWQLVGTYCRCTLLPDGDAWDVWVCNPADLRAGLGQRRVRAIRKSMPDLKFTELTGEGFFPRVPTARLLDSRVNLGLRKRARFSDEHKEKLAAGRSKSDSMQKGAQSD